jgi:hypothetical protein
MDLDQPPENGCANPCSAVASRIDDHGGVQELSDMGCLKRVLPVSTNQKMNNYLKEILLVTNN